MATTKGRNDMAYSCAVITVSDKGWRGERIDTSGPKVCEIARQNGFNVTHTAIVPDELSMIRNELIRCADELKVDLVLTTGGTGFSPRDVTPEATLSVIERETRGIPEAMRYASLQITPRGCLSRSAAGIRGRTLIINLPGSEKAARENLEAVIKAVQHGLDMLASEGSADCAAESKAVKSVAKAPSMDQWLSEAKKQSGADECGMYLFHNGVVRRSARARVRSGDSDAPEVKKLLLNYDREKVDSAVKAAYAMPGIRYVKVWINEGELSVGDDMMLVLVGGDIRPHVIDALQSLVGEIKNNCVSEQEIF